MSREFHLARHQRRPPHAPQHESCSDMRLDRMAGGPAGDPEVCGAMTSGGTESILTAVKASRDYMRAVRGIREPEMIIGDSAHAAFYKAAEYFRIKLIRVRTRIYLS